MKKDVGVIVLESGKSKMVQGKDLSLDCYSRNESSIETTEDPEYPYILKVGPTAAYIWQVMALEDQQLEISIFIKVPQSFFSTKSAHVRVLLCRGEEEEEVRVEQVGKFVKVNFEVNCLFDTLFMLKVCILTIDSSQRIEIGKIELKNRQVGG